jgi:hypothetical protein
MDFILSNGFENFMSGNGIWIVIGCLGFAFLVSIVFLILNIQKEKRAKQDQASSSLEQTKDDQAQQIASDLNTEIQKQTSITPPQQDSQTTTTDSLVAVSNEKPKGTRKSSTNKTKNSAEQNPALSQTKSKINKTIVLESSDKKAKSNTASKTKSTLKTTVKKSDTVDKPKNPTANN